MRKYSQDIGKYVEICTQIKNFKEKLIWSRDDFFIESVLVLVISCILMLYVKFHIGKIKLWEKTPNLSGILFLLNM